MSEEVRLARVTQAQRPALDALIDRYMREMVTFREWPVGPTCAADYAYLPLYWSDAGRHPFTIERDGETVGFVLVRQIEENGKPVSQMSEFSISPEARRSGLGRLALDCLWREIPGDWELQVHVLNTAAMAFWPAMIALHAVAAPTREEVVEDDGRRIEYRFRVAAAE